jgi:hypothetical protein
MKIKSITASVTALCWILPYCAFCAQLGREVAVPDHLQDGDEYGLSLKDLVAHGQKLFEANWTVQEGAGRPLSKGTGAPLSDPTRPLVFPRNFNRISGPDANSCAGCHGAPFGIPGGNGDFVSSVFVLGQRFDFATFDATNPIPTGSSVDETGTPVTLQSIGNLRATLGMFGSGYIEMLARQMTTELQGIRDATAPGASNQLSSKGVSFGSILRNPDGSWDVSRVEGLGAISLATSGTVPPSLLLLPFHQAGRVVSIREFSNNAYNHHHGIQSEERFGIGLDVDGDTFTNELTRADMTAVSVFQATMAVPGRVIPNDPEIEQAVLLGEEHFVSIGCARCHVPTLPLAQLGWNYSEPNPFNPAGNLRVGDTPALYLDLTDPVLPPPRLQPDGANVVYVPAFTDLKLHDITTGPDDPNVEPLDMHLPPGSPGFFAGNRRFITRRLWDAANKPNHFHHGRFTTMRESILAHAGEAETERLAFESLSDHDKDCLIEFLKTLQVLPPGTSSRIVDENHVAKVWPPVTMTSILRQDDQVTIRWQGGSPLDPHTRRCRVQYCTNLAENVWLDLGVPTTATSYSESAVDQGRFYRIVLTDN